MAADYDAIIVGAGVVGVFTAWALQERGLKICLVDREVGPAQQTSAANAGVIPWLCCPLRLARCCEEGLHQFISGR